MAGRKGLLWITMPLKIAALSTFFTKINPFMRNGISHPYQLDQSISVL